MEDVWLDEGQLRVRGTDGIVGVMCNYGETMEDAIDGMYEKIDKLRIGAPVQYRTDGAKRPIEAYKKLKSWKLKID